MRGETWGRGDALPAQTLGPWVSHPLAPALAGVEAGLDSSNWLLRGRGAFRIDFAEQGSAPS